MHLTLLSMLFVPALSLGESEAETAITDAKAAFALHSSLRLLNASPRFVSPELAELCVAPAPKDLAAKAAERDGPHANLAVNYFVSPKAMEAMASLDRKVPTGTILIKEKLSPTDGLANAVGGMVKRPEGFDPTNGDWEYFYASKDGSFVMGRIPNCVRCHARAREKDHVFTRARDGHAWRD